jgi:polysaccharide pyruvyl transferase WcaK-like protein
MRIILDNGAYTLRNMGDVAMLQTTVKRLREMLSRVELMILTTSPELLERYCPGTMPLSVQSRDCGYEPQCPARSDWAETWARLKLKWGSVPKGAREFQEAFEEAGAVFLCGGGFLNDINPYQTRPVLRMLEDAARRGKRVALFSQGLGPLESSELMALLRRACRAGARTALREPLYGPGILMRAGARSAQYAVTGDDAIQMALECGPAIGGHAIGFSVRQVAYSEVEARHLEMTSKATRGLSKSLGGKVVPLPISFNSHERDDQAIATVTATTAPREMLDSPEALIRATAECRILITGTYHAAVFGLSLGIPCVCFYVSTYYRHKMEGLARQFPGGCELVDLNMPKAAAQLVDAAMRAWEATGKTLSNRLREAAESQVQSGVKFYRAAIGL